jgi:hypothetical protein
MFLLIKFTKQNALIVITGFFTDIGAKSKAKSGFNTFSLFTLLLLTYRHLHSCLLTHYSNESIVPDSHCRSIECSFHS